jgi:hypothetical protein
MRNRIGKMWLENEEGARYILLWACLTGYENKITCRCGKYEMSISGRNELTVRVNLGAQHKTNSMNERFQHSNLTTTPCKGCACISPLTSGQRGLRNVTYRRSYIVTGIEFEAMLHGKIYAGIFYKEDGRTKGDKEKKFKVTQHVYHIWLKVYTGERDCLH